jgi:hypothetical protein
VTGRRSTVGNGKSAGTYAWDGRTVSKFQHCEPSDSDNDGRKRSRAGVGKNNQNFRLDAGSLASESASTCSEPAGRDSPAPAEPVPSFFSRPGAHIPGRIALAGIPDFNERTLGHRTGPYTSSKSGLRKRQSSLDSPDGLSNTQISRYTQGNSHVCA